jgi:hypothetical protein
LEANNLNIDQNKFENTLPVIDNVRNLTDAGTSTDDSIQSNSYKHDEREAYYRKSNKFERFMRRHYNDDYSSDGTDYDYHKRRIDPPHQITKSIDEAQCNSSLIAENFMDKILFQKIEHIEGDFEKSLKEHSASLLLSQKRCESEIEITKYNAETNRLVVLKEIRNAEAEILRLKEKSWCVIQ